MSLICMVMSFPYPPPSPGIGHFSGR
jgi:hypothetical protein